MKPKILVVGAVGKTGKEVTLRLLARGFSVRAFVRREDERSASLARRARSHKLLQAGAEIFVGDLAEIDNLTQAMNEVQRAYFLAPFNPGQLYKSMVLAR